MHHYRFALALLITSCAVPMGEKVDEGTDTGGLSNVNSDADTDADADTDTDADADGDADAASVCGDGVLDEGEECDHGEANSNEVPDACRMDCRNPFCGDGVVDAAEECDGEPGVGCDEFGFPHGVVLCTDCSHDEALCTDEEIVVCGDGVIGAGESCDDGNAEDGDGCTSLCQLCTDDDAEDDDVPEFAAALTTTEPVSRVLQSGDEDYFEMFLLPGCAIYLDATFSHADGDLQLEVVNIEGEAIGEPGHTDTDNERAIFAPSGFIGGTFHARAYIDGAGACVPYTLVWNCFDPDA